MKKKKTEIIQQDKKISDKKHKKEKENENSILESEKTENEAGKNVFPKTEKTGRNDMPEYQSDFEKFVETEIDTSKYDFEDNPKIENPKTEIKQNDTFKTAFSGYAFLLLIDFIFPAANSLFFKWATGYKISPSLIKLDKQTIKELEPIAERIVNKWLPELPDELLLFMLLEIHYFAKLEAVKSTMPQLNKPKNQ